MISFAILIDLLQALISAALFVVGAFPGTVGGAAGGCAAGAAVAGKVGCAVGGFFGGLIGTPADALAAYTLPLATGLGFAVNFCLDVTLGTVLVMWLISQDMYYPSYGIGGFVAELIPGINDLPAWTTMTVLSVMRKSAEEGKLSGTPAGAITRIATAGGVAGMATAAVAEVRQAREGQARTATQEQQASGDEYRRDHVAVQLKNIDGVRAPRQPHDRLEPSPYAA